MAKVLPSVRDHVVIESVERANGTFAASLVNQSFKSTFCGIFNEIGSIRTGGWEGVCQLLAVIRLIYWLIDRLIRQGALRRCPTWWSPETSRIQTRSSSRVPVLWIRTLCLGEGVWGGRDWRKKGGRSSSSGLWVNVSVFGGTVTIQTSQLTCTVPLVFCVEMRAGSFHHSKNKLSCELFSWVLEPRGGRERERERESERERDSYPHTELIRNAI